MPHGAFIKEETLQAIGSGLWPALAASCVAAPIIYRVLLKMKARQTVSEYVPEHQGKQGTPTMGGLIVVLGLLVAYAWIIEVAGYGIWPERSSGSWDEARRYGSPTPFLILLLGFALIGFADDYLVPKLLAGKRGLSWVPKLVMQFGCAVPVAWLSGDGDAFNAVASAFLIVAFSNAYNFSDGMDGLAGGIAVIFALALLAIGVQSYAPLWHSSLCIAIVGASLPFLFLNAPPARLFMGDVGSLPIGAVLGWLLLESRGLHSSRFDLPVSWPLSVTVLSLVLVAELLPVPLQIFWVKVFKRRLFPMTPIHHAFQKAGWPETRVVVFFHICQAILAFYAVYVALSNWDPTLR